MNQIGSLVDSTMLIPEADLEENAVCAPPFLQSLVVVFFDHSEDLKTVLIEVKLITNNAPLTCVNANTIKACLTLNHLLFGKQLLYYSNTTSTVVRNLTVLSSSTNKINRISYHFWHRWRHEYAAKLCETQQTSKLKINSQKIYSASL